MLYWACMFEEIEPAVVRELMAHMEAYPEGPVLSDSHKTPCHAAAQVGN